MIERINPKSLPPTAGQSQLVITDAKRTVYISGQVALDTEGNVVGEGDFRAQTVQVLANVSAGLEAAGARPSDVLKMTIFVVRLDTAVHGPILAELLGDLSDFHHPAATLVSVAGLVRPVFLIEIEAVAAAG